MRLWRRPKRKRPRKKESTDEIEESDSEEEVTGMKKTQ